jgi:hypothetical protein
MLAMREDSFPDYTLDGFEAAMKTRFEQIDRTPIEGSERMMYLFKSRQFDSV